MWPVVVVLAILVPLILVLGRRMQMLEMGDDAAKALGVRAEPTRLSLVVLGVALTAMVTAAAGPIGFVSLAAPQLVRRLTGSAGVTLLPSAAMGGALLMVATGWRSELSRRHSCRSASSPSPSVASISYGFSRERHVSSDR